MFFCFSIRLLSIEFTHFFFCSFFIFEFRNGNLFSRILGLFGSKEARTIMLGLDDSGKTTILYSLKLGECVTPILNMGVSVESAKFRNLNLIIWDACNRVRVQAFCYKYYPNTKAIIFVVDCNDRDCMEEANEALHNVLSHKDLEGVPLLVFANKQDLPNAASPEELAELFKLNIIVDRKWHVAKSCASTGDGLIEGFDWLEDTVFP